MAVSHHEGCVVAPGLNRPSGKFQSGLDVLTGQFGVGFFDIFECGSRLEHLKNQIHHNAGSLKAGFAVADFGIDGDKFSDIHI